MGLLGPLSERGGVWAAGGCDVRLPELWLGTQGSSPAPVARWGREMHCGTGVRPGRCGYVVGRRWVSGATIRAEPRAVASKQALGCRSVPNGTLERLPRAWRGRWVLGAPICSEPWAVTLGWAVGRGWWRIISACGCREAGDDDTGLSLRKSQAQGRANSGAPLCDE